MARYVSHKNPISANTLKRKPTGSVVVHHWSYGGARFTRVNGGWLAEREDRPAEVVSSDVVADECNRAIGCKESWARIY